MDLPSGGHLYQKQDRNLVTGLEDEVWAGLRDKADMSRLEVGCSSSDMNLGLPDAN